MYKVNDFARRLFAVSLLSVGFATMAVADGAAIGFAGPRSTIPKQQRIEPANQPIGRLLVSRHEQALCKAVRVVHHGHPGKGVSRVERIDVPCGNTRLSTR